MIWGSRCAAPGTPECAERREVLSISRARHTSAPSNVPRAHCSTRHQLSGIARWACAWCSADPGSRLMVGTENATWVPGLQRTVLLSLTHDHDLGPRCAAPGTPEFAERREVLSISRARHTAAPSNVPRAHCSTRHQLSGIARWACAWCSADPGSRLMVCTKNAIWVPGLQRTVLPSLTQGYDLGFTLRCARDTRVCRAEGSPVDIARQAHIRSLQRSPGALQHAPPAGSDCEMGARVVQCRPGVSFDGLHGERDMGPRSAAHRSAVTDARS
jgi:hypothetical protein